MVSVDKGICQLMPLLGGVELLEGIWLDMGGVGEETSRSFNVLEVGFMVWGEMPPGVGDSFPERASAHEFDILLETELELQGALYC